MKQHFLLASVTAVLASTSYAHSETYQECVVSEAKFYSMYCFSTGDIVMTVRGLCRNRDVPAITENQILSGRDKAELKEEYMKISDEIVVNVILDNRIKNKIDCGQYNNVVGPDAIDRAKKN